MSKQPFKQKTESLIDQSGKNNIKTKVDNEKPKTYSSYLEQECNSSFNIHV